MAGTARELSTYSFLWFVVDDKNNLIDAHLMMNFNETEAKMIKASYSDNKNLKVKAFTLKEVI